MGNARRTDSSSDFLHDGGIHRYKPRSGSALPAIVKANINKTQQIGTLLRVITYKNNVKGRGRRGEKELLSLYR